MAQKLIAIKNNSGQALIEATLMMVVAGAFLYLLLRSLLIIIFSVAVDSMAEDYFFCELVKKPNCEQRLYHRLKDNQLKNISVSTRKIGHRMILTISATHLTSMTVAREFDYENFRQSL